MPKLLLKFNAAVIKEIPLDKDAVTVGRKADNDICIDNPAISGHHCRVSKEGGGWFIEDLESTNGTFVNEKRIKKSGLHHNDVVTIAKHALVLINEAEAAAEAGEPAPSADATMVITAEKQAELAASATQNSKPAADTKAGWLRVLQGKVGEAAEYEIKGMSLYIGKSDRVQIQIKGAGLFGSAPEVAASIHRKPEGFVIVAVTEGYPSVNGAKIAASTLLKNGDIIECGATTMMFELRG